MSVGLQRTATGSVDAVPRVRISVSSVLGADGRTYSVTNHVRKDYQAAGRRHEWLLAWAGDDAQSTSQTDPDFMAVIDATENSPTYGKVVNTVTVSPQTLNEPHHMQYVWHKGDHIYAGGLLSDTSYVFDATALPRLSLTGVATPTATPCGSMPDAFWVLHDGTAYGTEMGGPDVSGPCTYSDGQVREGNGYAGSPGEVVRLAPDGRVLSEAPAATAEGEDPTLCHNVPDLPQPTCANPHGLQVREDLNRMVTSDLFEPRDFLDQTQANFDAAQARDTVRTWDISDRSRPRLLSVTHLPAGPRPEQFELFKEPHMVMENSVTNLPGHRGAFAATMAGGAVYYTPDITASQPAWREIFDDETAYRTFYPNGDAPSGGDVAGWLQTSPDDRYLFHTVLGTAFAAPGVVTGMVYVLDIQKLLASGNDPQCRIDQLEEVTAGGGEADCPALAGVLPIPDDTSGGPHWASLDHFALGSDGLYHETRTVRRLAVANYMVTRFGMDGNHKLCMMDFGAPGLSLDPNFRDEVTGAPCVDFNRQSWPHGATGSARPHGVLFVLADDDVG